MSETFKKILGLVERGEIRISDHGYDQAAEDAISIRGTVLGLMHAKVVEDYPDYPKGPCVLLAQRDSTGKTIHAVWGIPRRMDSPAVLVTAYRPDPRIWSEDFLRRRG